MDLVAHVRERLVPVVRPGDRLLAGLSGGIDSVVLLDVLVRVAASMPFELTALHVNHQLSPNAARWADFCSALCRARGVDCRVVTVDVAGGNSIERAARDARYAAFHGAGADHIVLAHNQDDQAETVLLQLLRGAGAKGLAAMPGVRMRAATSLLRPLLDVPRTQIERHAKAHRLEWLEDESNADARYTRNWLRHEVIPRIETRIPSYREALARAARNLGEAAGLLDDLARLDCEQALEGDALQLAVIRALGFARAKNLLRFLIARHGWRMPEANRLEEALRQVLHARADRRPAVSLGDCELRRHRGLIHLVHKSVPIATAAALTWLGEPELALPHAGGVLLMTRGRGEGISLARLAREAVTIRVRVGGERLQPFPTRPRRTVKNLLQESALPPWERATLPFIFCGEQLVCVPGVAVDCRFAAAPDELSVSASWAAASAAGLAD